MNDFIAFQLQDGMSLCLSVTKIKIKIKLFISMSMTSWRTGKLLPNNPIEENNDKLGQLIRNKTVHPINSFPPDLHWN